ncbi:F-box protein SKIP23 isoform X2 [Euphorbia lathyris]|uniref:F-box protein SKIP23 isoform X2 n=1 Tax=Euphorbia lathyris TaxID=212925 RepID=UPI00331430CE
MAEWSLLPKDLLEQISNYFDTSIDLLRFRSVCTSWRSSVSPKPRCPSGSFRILPNDGISCASFGFYLTKRTIFLIRLPDYHHQTSSDCWLVKIEEESPNRKHLLNPLSRYRFNSLPRSFPRPLDLLNFRVFELGQEYVLHHVNYKPSSPSIPDAGNLYMEKVVITWLNHGSQFLLLTIHVSGKLAFFKSGDKKWTIIQEMPSPYDDVIAYNEKLYAVDHTGRTVCVGLNAELNLIANPVFGGDRKCLVESRGQLLLVDTYLSIDTADENQDVGEESLEHLAQYMSERTVRFKVFKLEEALQSWIGVNSLDDRVLFLGEYSSFSASAADLSGCSGNCIFFMDSFFYPRDENTDEEEDSVLVGGDIGVFDLGIASIGPLSNYPEYSKMFWPPPDWVSSTSLEVQTQNQFEDLSLRNND